MVQAFREEIHDLYQHGCRRIQFDDAGFCFFCSEAMISSMEAKGVDHEELLSKHIKVYNAVTADRPEDLSIGVHTCRGNMKVRVLLIYNISLHVSRIGHRACTLLKEGTSGWRESYCVTWTWTCST